MTPEQHPESLPSINRDFRAKDNANTNEQANFDPYEAAEEIYNLVVEFMKQRGELRRPLEITSEDEQDDHFDDLARVYKRTILFLGLDWPPPVRDIPVDNE